MKIRIEPNDIQYMGMSGYSAPCLDAVETIVTNRRPPKRMTLVSTLQRPVPTSPSIPGDHLFLAWDWNRVPLTVIHSGFATGYHGTGSRYFSLALCMILSENIEVVSRECNRFEFDAIDEKRVTDQIIESLRYIDALDDSEARDEWISNGWIYSAHLEELERGSFWSDYRGGPSAMGSHSKVRSSVGESKRPTAFISYYWNDEDHKGWVEDLATCLWEDGVDVKLDKWVPPGYLIPEFIEKGVRESDFVVIICTPHYKERSDKREGWVGYEGSVITEELFRGQGNRNKFIPVLRSGKWTDATPSWIADRVSVDLSGKVYSEQEYARLRDTLLGRTEVAPPIGGGR